MSRRHATTTAGPDVRAYDHSKLARLPEYHRARAAIDALQNAIAQSMTWADAVTLVGDIVRTNYTADWCPNCRRDPDPLRYPIAVQRDNTSLHCTYRCHICCHVWTCDWTSDPTHLA